MSPAGPSPIAGPFCVFFRLGKSPSSRRRVAAPGARGHVRVRVRVSVCGGRRACVLYRVLLQSVGYIAGCWEGYITKLTKLPSPPRPLSPGPVSVCVPPPSSSSWHDVFLSGTDTALRAFPRTEREKRGKRKKERKRDTERERKKERERERERNTDRKTSEAADVMQGHVIRRGRLPRSRASRRARTG